MITQKELKEILHYDPETGIWTWLVSNSKRVRVGDKAGYLCTHNGYWRIKINGKRYRSNRLAFLYMTGKWPNVADHENRIRNDNRWKNLRDLDSSGNNKNKEKSLKTKYLNVASGIIQGTLSIS